MEVKVGGIYKHFKGGFHLVEDIVFNSETMEKMVLYRDLCEDCKRFVRPYDMFVSKVDKVKYPNVKQEYRFEYTYINKNQGLN